MAGQRPTRIIHHNPHCGNLRERLEMGALLVRGRLSHGERDMDERVKDKPVYCPVCAEKGIQREMKRFEACALAGKLKCKECDG